MQLRGVLDREAVGGALAEPVLGRLALDAPVQCSGGVGRPGACCLGGDGGLDRDAGVAVGVQGLVGLRLGVHLDQPVQRPVDRGVEADGEVVLVGRCLDVRRHHPAGPRGLAVGDAGHGHDARQLHLELDGSVLVQGPVEAVVVVRDRREARDDEPAAAPDLGAAGAGVHVLPEDRVVLLVQADAVDDGLRFAVAVEVVDVEVADLAEAVAAELEARGERTGAVLAPVEEVLPVRRRVAVEVRDVHLVDRRAVQHRALDLAVAVAQVVQHEPLAVGEPDAERPVLPADLVSVDREAGAVRLHDVERRDLAVGTPGAGGVDAGLARHRDDPVVLDADDLERVQVEDRDEPGDGPGVAVVLGELAVPDGAPAQAAVGEVLRDEAGDRLRVDPDERRVGDAAFRERLDDERGLPRGLRDEPGLVARDARATVVDVGPQLDDRGRVRPGRPPRTSQAACASGSITTSRTGRAPPAAVPRAFSSSRAIPRSAVVRRSGRTRGPRRRRRRSRRR